MNELFVNGKIKPTFFVILMLTVSILSGCVSDEGTIIEADNNENNNGGNESTNNTGNETVNNTGNETVNNTGNNTLSLSKQCLSGHSNLAMHIHPWLNLTVRGTEIPIPENMGIDTSDCPNAMHLLHTHDDTGKLHIETYEPITLNLSLFFAVWNISQSGDSTFDPLFLDPDNVTITIEGVEQTVGINEVIFEDGISIHVIFDDSDFNQTGDDDVPCGPSSVDTNESDSNLPDGSCCNSGGQCASTNCNYENWTCEPMPEWIDSDADGWEDEFDAFPFDPNEWMDSDNDSVGDNSDAFPYDSNESSDSDGDGVGDNSDAFPNDPNESSDSDGDGIGDNSDQDDDNDGWNNTDEIDCQTDPADLNSIPQDTDGDGICDPLDPVNNLMWTNNSAHFLYVKPDTIANSNIENAKPYQIEFVANPMAQQNPVILTQICDKGQGHVADVWSAFVLGPFPYDIISWHIYNTNGQSIGMFVSRDNLTQSSNMTFPTVISTQDTENQSSGHLEAEVIDSQYYTCEFDYTDTDGDGVLDWMDAFPDDECATTDTDGDGLPDNILDGANDPIPNCQTNLIEDDDDDGDTCPDNMDWAPLNSTECFDTDGDGIGDNGDPTPWISNGGNGTFTMNYTMIGIDTCHTLYWLGQNYNAYCYSTSPDMVWNDGPRAEVFSQEHMPNVDAVLALMGYTIDDLSVSTYPVNLGTDTENVEWGYDDSTYIEWRALSSNLSILYLDDQPLFSMNASLMLYLDYSDTISSWGADPVTMWGNSSFSPITSMIPVNAPWIHHHLFSAYMEDFGGKNINYSFTSQDAIITTDYSFDNTDNNLTGWLTSLIANEGSVLGGLFDSVVSEVNVEPSQNGITMSKTIQPTENKMAVLSERIKEDEDPYFNE